MQLCNGTLFSIVFFFPSRLRKTKGSNHYNCKKT